MNGFDLWGELPTQRISSPLLTPQERDVLTKLPKSLNLEGPRIYQPAGGDRTSGPTFASPKETQIQDDWVLGGIRLLNYRSDLQIIHENLLKKKEMVGAGFASGSSPTLDLPPLPPSISAKDRTHRKEGLFSNPSPAGDSKDGILSGFELKDEKSEESSESPPLSATVVRQLMHKSVAAVSAFYGYDQSTDEALNVLTDVSCDFMRHFCQMLRLARDNQLLGNSSGFADVMERTYLDMNLGSILDVRDFYHNSVIGRYKAIRKECKQAHEECQNLMSENGPRFSGAGYAFDPNLVAVEGSGDCLDNIPEIHFPSSEEGDMAAFSLDHSTPQMETGLQMLQSLEQGTYATMGGTVGSTGDDPLSHDSNSGIMLGQGSPMSGRKRQKT